MAHLYAFTAYDALWLSGLTYVSSNQSSDIGILKRTLIKTASTYDGATGLTVLNEAGDRRSAGYDFWVINETNGSFNWLSNIRKPHLLELDVKITAVLNKMDHDLSHAALELSETDMGDDRARKILGIFAFQIRMLLIVRPLTGME